MHVPLLAPLFAALCAVLPLSGRAQVVASPCESLMAPGSFTVNGLSLTPYSGSPQAVRDLSTRLDAPGCTRSVIEQISRYRAERPDDHTIALVEARVLWRSNDVEGAWNHLAPVVKAHPGFASGHVLLGAIATERNRIPEAAEHYAAARKLAPDDLWLYIGERRLALRAGRLEAAGDLATLASTRTLPNAVRESAALAVTQSAAPAVLRAQVLRDTLTYDTTNPRFRQVRKLAHVLIEELHEYDEARELLAESLATDGHPDTRLTLAASYLVEAYLLPAASPGRAPLVDRAREVMGGDDALVAAIKPSPHYGPLAALLGAAPGPNEPNADGVTPMCLAAMQGDADGIASQLARGGDPNATCEDRSVLALAYSIVANGERRMAVMKRLLDAGADPNGPYGSGTVMSHCESTPSDCPREMATLLRGFGGRPAQAQTIARPPPPPDPPICAAVRDRDLDAIRVELAASDNEMVHAWCAGAPTLVQLAVRYGMKDLARLKPVLETLVQAGGEVRQDFLEQCEREVACARDVLPLLRR